LYTLNEGGFGVVFSGLSRTGAGVAIKMIKPTPHIEKEWDSWLREVKVCIKCYAHPHIVQIHDFFPTKDGYLAIIMEKAEGSLSDLIGANLEFSTREICVIGLQILDALDFIHSMGVLHRDVTPKNILIFPNGVYKLADFGIAKEFITSTELARTLIGYRSYVPPELLWHGYSSEKSDIYQLGLALLTLLIQRDPIPRGLSPEKTNDFIFAGIPRQKAESLIDLGGTKGKLAEIISIMLRRHDQFRFQDASEVYAELNKVIKTHDRLQALLTAMKKRLPTNKQPPSHK
jgi:serine/threonine protein kinase